MPDNPAAALARKRWKGTTKEERAKAASEAAKARWAKTTPEERSAFAKRIRKGKTT